MYFTTYALPQPSLCALSLLSPLPLRLSRRVAEHRFNRSLHPGFAEALQENSARVEHSVPTWRRRAESSPAVRRRDCKRLTDTSLPQLEVASAVDDIANRSGLTRTAIARWTTPSRARF